MKVKNKSKKKKLIGGVGNPSEKEIFFIRIHRIGYLLKEINKEIKFYDTSGSHEYSPKRYEKAVYNQFYTESKEEAEKIKNNLFKEKPFKHNLDFTSSPILNINKPISKSEGFMAIEKVEIYNDYGSTVYINDEIKEEIKAAKELIKKFKENNNKSLKGENKNKNKSKNKGS